MIFLALVVSFNAAMIAIVALGYGLVIRRRMRMYLLVEQLAAMVRREMPIETSLRMLARDLRGFLGARLTRVARAIEEGRDVGDAFAACPRAFPPMLRSFVSLGARHGNLAAFLEELRRVYRGAFEAPSRAVFFVLYPVLVTVVTSLFFSSSGFGIADKFNEIFLSMGMTAAGGRFMAMMTFIEFAAAGVAGLGVCVAAAVAWGAGSAHYSMTLLSWPKGAAERAALVIPGVGGVLRAAALYRFAAAAAMLMRAGATMVEAVDAAAEAEPNSVLRRRLGAVADRVAQGESLSGACGRDRLFPSEFVWLIRTGEAAGTLADRLSAAGAYFESRIQFASHLGVQALVPAALLVNGALVAMGFFAFL